LPESPVNEEIGVFMVNITFYTTEGRFLSTSARPVRERKGDIFCFCSDIDSVDTVANGTVVQC